jgi:hypothetical protein
VTKREHFRGSCDSSGGFLVTYSPLYLFCASTLETQLKT